MARFWRMASEADWGGGESVQGLASWKRAELVIPDHLRRSSHDIRGRGVDSGKAQRRSVGGSVCTSRDTRGLHGRTRVVGWAEMVVPARSEPDGRSRSGAGPGLATGRFPLRVRSADYPRTGGSRVVKAYSRRWERFKGSRPLRRNCAIYLRRRRPSPWICSDVADLGM